MTITFQLHCSGKQLFIPLLIIMLCNCRNNKLVHCYLSNELQAKLNVCTCTRNTCIVPKTLIPGNIKTLNQSLEKASAIPTPHRHWVGGSGYHYVKQESCKNRKWFLKGYVWHKIIIKQFLLNRSTSLSILCLLIKRIS